MKPNFVFVLSDEERYPTNYDPASYMKNLPAHNYLASHGYTSEHHYTASAACSPSRASIFTGQYPEVHQVKETYGGAKDYNDPRMVWLRPNTVPTMGQYFKELGYDTVYIGKWHISFEDIVDDDGVTLPTVQLDGTPDQINVEYYKREQRLHKFGFNEWIGPDPHGTSQRNAGWLRDPDYVRQVTNWFDTREKIINPRPFLLVVSLVNPHDIVYFPFLWTWFQYPLRGKQTPKELKPIPTFSENIQINNKPTPQVNYLKQYGKIFAPIMRLINHKYRQLYYYLISTVDQEIYKIIKRLEKSSFYDNTYTIFTSDHGDLLGAHGGMYQKWYSAYEEIVHIPFIISHPSFTANKFDGLTSSIDILPTMLGLTGITNAQEIALNKVTKYCSEAHPLKGTDLTPFIFNKHKERPVSQVYIQIEDEISRGNNQVTTMAKMYPILKWLYHFEYNHIEGPTSIEALIYYCHGEKWKLVRYWDNPSKWTCPYEYDTSDENEHWYHRGMVEKRTNLLSDEYELYNVTNDPEEEYNLYNYKKLDIDDIRYGMVNLLGQYKDKRGKPNKIISRVDNIEYNNKLVRVKQFADSPFGLFMIGNIAIMTIFVVAASVVQLVVSFLY